MRRPLRRLTACLPCRYGIRAFDGSVSTIPAQHPSAGLGCSQCRLCPLADQFALLLRHRRVYPQHQVVRPRHVRGADRDAVLQQLREGVCAACDAIEPGCHQHGVKLTTAGQRCLKSRSPVVLAGGDVREFRHERPALHRDERPDASLLGLQAQPAVSLLGGRDPDQPHRKTGRVRALAHQPASAGVAAAPITMR